MYDEAINQTWGEDLRSSPNARLAIAGAIRQCREAGIEFRHRRDGWAIKINDRPWRSFWSREVNVFIDFIEQLAIERKEIAQ